MSISHCTKPITKQVEDTVLIEDEKLLQDTNSSSWAVFHSLSQPIPRFQDTSVMLPTLRDNSKSPATIKHLLNVLMQSIHQLNPNQTAVIGFDQPLYVLAKKIQWFQLAIYGRQNLVVMLYAIDIEIVLLKCLGDWLQDSGWKTALLNVGVTSSGNDSLLSGHEVGKTKYVHQVTALTLYQLMKDAFEQSKKENCNLSFAEWHTSKDLESSQFHFWSIALKMEMDYSLFLRSIRSSNFKLYDASIGKFLPWIFAFDHGHYARWLSIHHYDMEMLKESSLDVFQKFDVNGNFTVTRTKFWNQILDNGFGPTPRAFE